VHYTESCPFSIHFCQVAKFEAARLESSIVKILAAQENKRPNLKIGA
jgi:hypothetical protein